MAQQRLIALFFKVFEVILNEIDEDGVTIVASGVQLDEQTFGKGNARPRRRIEILDGGEHGRHFGGIRAGEGGDFFVGGGEVAGFVEVADDALADGLLFFR